MVNVALIFSFNCGSCVSTLGKRLKMHKSCGATYMSSARSCEEKGRQQDKWQVPWVIGVRHGREEGHEDAGWRQRLFAPGPVDQCPDGRDGDVELHSWFNALFAAAAASRDDVRRNLAGIRQEVEFAR
jgi:hypothetical protein